MSIFFTACVKLNSSEKNSPTIIDFTFVDYYTNKPVVGYKVYLAKQHFSLFSDMGSPTDIMDTFIADNKGHISSSFQNKEGYLYYIQYNEYGRYQPNNNIYGAFDPINLITGERNTKQIAIKKICRSGFAIPNF